METTIPKRPHSRDPDIMEAAAARMVEGVREKFDGLSDEEIAKGLRHALARAMSLDGYDIARRLENDNLCEPDAEMVEMLDTAYGYVFQAHREAVKGWVRGNNITLKRKVGDRIRYREEAGAIGEIDPELAAYLFRPDGDTRFEKGGGIYVTEEDAKDIEPAGVAS